MGMDLLSSSIVSTCLGTGSGNHPSGNKILLEDGTKVLLEDGTSKVFKDPNP